MKGERQQAGSRHRRPRLHYRPQHDRKLKLTDEITAAFKKFNKDYRQFQGEETCVYWLLEQGYALTTFDNSMDADEIERLTAIADTAARGKTPTW